MLNISKCEYCNRVINLYPPVGYCIWCRHQKNCELCSRPGLRMYKELWLCKNHLLKLD